MLLETSASTPRQPTKVNESPSYIMYTFPAIVATARAASLYGVASAQRSAAPAIDPCRALRVSAESDVSVTYLCTNSLEHRDLDFLTFLMKHGEYVANARASLPRANDAIYMYSVLSTAPVVNPGHRTIPCGASPDAKPL